MFRKLTSLFVLVSFLFTIIIPPSYAQNIFTLPMKPMPLILLSAMVAPSNGNILTITDNVNTADQTFTYDELNRLKTADAPGSYGFKSYTYDEIGNIRTKDGLTYTYWGEAGCPGSGFTPGGPHAVCKLSDGSQFGYDVNGNMVKEKKGSTTKDYIYDVENRLIRYKRNGVVKEEYEYDGDGGRVKKIKYTVSPPSGGGMMSMAIGGGVEVTRYIGSLYEEGDSDTVNTRYTKYIFLGDQWIASVTSTTGGINDQVMYYHADHLGGTNVLTDSTKVSSAREENSF